MGRRSTKISTFQQREQLRVFKTLIAMLQLTIKTENVAFQPSEGYEVARILKELATKIENDLKFTELCQPLRDLNGNTVGYYKTWTETAPLDDETLACIEAT